MFDGFLKGLRGSECWHPDNAVTRQTIGTHTNAHCTKCGKVWTYPYAQPKLPFIKLCGQCGNPENHPICCLSGGASPDPYKYITKEMEEFGGKKFFQIKPDMPASVRIYIGKLNAEYKAKLIAKHGHHKYQMREPIAKMVTAVSIETNHRKFRDD